jgi:hypothetical protein
LPKVPIVVFFLCALVAAGCGSSPSRPTTPTTPTSPTPPPAQTSGVNGTAIDAVSDRPLGGVTVRVEGLGEAITNASGAFHFDAADPQMVRAVSVSSSQTVDRATRLRVPGPDATLALMPSTLDLAAFDQMFRGNAGALRRWTTAPRVVIQNRVLQFTNVSDLDYTAAGQVMSDGEATALVGDLTWALPQLTGTTFTAFAGEQRETAAEGDRVRVSRSGLIVVARYEGLTAGTGYWGYTRWSWNGAGEMIAGIVMLDRAFDTSSSPYRRSLRAHEFGHALGYNHVTGRASVMNQAATTEPNPFDRDAAKFAFQRPPLNRSPDIDPDPFTGNLRALMSQIFWAGAS